MTSSKIDSAVRQAIAAGVRPSDAAPPFYRLAWRLGLGLRPPLYAGFAVNALVMGGFYGVSMGVLGLLWAMSRPGWRPALVLPVLGLACVAGAVFGVLMAGLMRRRARRAGLPSWDRLES
jgi:apolipoprotein N-acyltransferase